MSCFLLWRFNFFSYFNSYPLNYTSPGNLLPVGVGMGRCTPLTPALETKARLARIASSRPAKAETLPRFISFVTTLEYA